MEKHFFKNWLVVLALLVHLPGKAEDIDLFMGLTPAVTDVPNVLIVLDNTANWNTAFANEKAALVAVFNGLTLNRFKVGLMMFTETGSGNSGNDGAYVRAAMRLMNSTNRPLYSTLINSLDQTGDSGNAGKIGKSMEEAYLYLSGGTPHAGNNKNKTDYAGNTSEAAASTAIYALTGNALSSKAATTYNSPVTAESCSKNYIIYISNGAAQDSSSDTTQATTALASAGGSTTTIPLNPSGSQDNIADEWARFLKVSSLGATVYTVDINKVTTGQGPGWTALLKSAAAQSSGKYFDVASSGTQIQDALNNIFSEIQSVNSVFASVSLPVSVNTQGTFLNQVFIGMFRPDADANPRWNGNLKQYQMGIITGGVELQDAAGVNALNSQTGFVTECARSFWTPTTVDTEWTSNPLGDCLTVANSKGSNFPDGNVVEKGGQAYKLRQSSTRTVNTCNASMASCRGTDTGGTGLTPFSTTNVTQAQLGAADAAEQSALINWAIGEDNKNDENGNLVTTDRRLSAHGDVVHSRPVAVNFGSDSAPNVVVFYGGNDGMLRAINGNQTSAIGTIPAGGELWSFMPPEFYSSIKRLRNNNTPIQFPSSVTGSPATSSKPYGIDGPITAFTGTLGGSSRTFVYATMRRGGRALYAFDVTNSITSPSSPTLKWKIGCEDSGCSTGLSGIGQTWSAAKSFTASGYGSGATPLLVMGGGYDNCEDYDFLTSVGANHNCTSSSKGHYVYVLDAYTGAVLKAFDTGETRGVIADITIVRDSVDQALYGYTADLGGNVYRITFGDGTAASDNSSSWSMTKIASLGCDTTATCTANRKFMFAPSVVSVDGNYVVMIGSGDREKPLTYFASANAVPNLFFMFTDKPTIAASTWPGSADCTGTAIICKSSLFGITGSSTPSATDLAAKKGWYLSMTSTEQVVTSAVTVFGTVSFSTHQPAAPVDGSCKSNLGIARTYNVKYTNAASTNGTDSRSQDIVGGGLAPSPVAGQVTIGTKTIPFCIGCANEILKSKLPSSVGFVVQPKGRLYWYIQK